MSETLLQKEERLWLESVEKGVKFLAKIQKKRPITAKDIVIAHTTFGLDYKFLKWLLNKNG